MDNKKKFGIGLEAIFGTQSHSTGIEHVLLEQIEQSEWQPRKNFDENSLVELASSITTHGVLQPVLLKRIANNKYKIIAGERRVRASVIAQKKTIPAILVDFDSQTLLEISMIENLQRKDLNPVEKAEGFAFLIEKLNINHETLAARLGLSRSMITNYLRISTLPEHIKHSIADGKITFGHAKILANKKNIDELSKKIIDKKLSVRDTEKMISYKTKEDDVHKTDQKNSSDIQQFEKMICMAIGLQTNIVMKNNSGEVKLQFKNLNELEKIIAKLCM
jgi:ParB family chromosome partitioning protein